MIAYDYTAQCWVEDTAQARDIRIKQCEDELAILRGPRGNEYARFCDAERPDRLAMIATLEIELAGLRDQL
jgi:hypothetical protein